MNKNSDPKATKRPFRGERPFPWKCHHCFKNEVVMATVSYNAEIKHDGRFYAFTIPELKLPICQACGEKVFTEKVDDQITVALREHLHLLSPEEIRMGLERLNLTQKEAAKRLGIAEATLSHWLTDTQIQSRSLDNLLRLFFAFANVRDALTHQCWPVSAKFGKQAAPSTSEVAQEHATQASGPTPNDGGTSGPVNRIGGYLATRYSNDEEQSANAAKGERFALFLN